MSTPPVHPDGHRLSLDGQGHLPVPCDCTVRLVLPADLEPGMLRPLSGGPAIIARIVPTERCANVTLLWPTDDPDVWRPCVHGQDWERAMTVVDGPPVEVPAWTWGPGFTTHEAAQPAEVAA